MTGTTVCTIPDLFQRKGHDVTLALVFISGDATIKLRSHERFLSDVLCRRHNWESV